MYDDALFLDISWFKKKNLCLPSILFSPLYELNNKYIHYNISWKLEAFEIIFFFLHLDASVACFLNRAPIQMREFIGSS